MPAESGNKATLAHVALGGFLLLGAPFGIVALGPGLLRAGLFGNLCHGKKEPCFDQTVALAQAFSFILVSGRLAMLPAGMLIDRYGPRTPFFWGIVAVAVGYGISGIDLRTGVAFVLGQTLTTNAGYCVGGMGVNLLPQVLPPESIDRWMSAIGTIVDLGAAVSVAIAFFIQSELLPVWICFVVVAAVLLLIFIPLHHYGIVNSTDPRTESLPTLELVKRRSVILQIMYMAAITAFTSGIEACAMRLLQVRGGAAAGDLAVYVPLVTGVGGALFAGAFCLTGGDHVRVGFFLRVALLVATVALLCALSETEGTWAVWAAITGMQGLRGMSMQAVFRVQFEISPKGSESTVTGLTWTLGGLVAILPGQAVTYLLPYSPIARIITSVVCGFAITALDAGNMQMLVNSSSTPASKTLDQNPDEGTALIPVGATACP